MLLHSMLRSRLSQVPVCPLRKKICCRLKSSQTNSDAQMKQLKHVQCSDSTSHFLGSYDTFLLDCDGVLWDSYHDKPIPGIPNAIDKLHQLGKKVLYVTNNSKISRRDLKEKFQRYGFDAPMENIFSTGHAAAVYIKDILKIRGKVYLVGGTGMAWELDQAGLENFGAGPDLDTPTNDANELLKMKFENNVDTVLVGFDQFVSYNKIYKAASYLTNPKCHFIGTHDTDQGVFIGTNQDRRMPMTGMIVNAIAVTSNRTAMILGKPGSMMFDCLVDKHADIVKSRTVMIGDSLKADMGFAKSVGIDSALVLTGNSRLENIRETPHLMPNYVLNSLVDICK